MTTILGERLRMIRGQKGVQALEVATAIGVARSTLSLYESGMREPNMDILKKIANYYQVPIGFFFGISGNQEKNYKEILNIVHIPIYNSIRAGSPGEGTDNDILGYQDLPAAWLGDEANYFAIQVDTTSMEPKITLGDVLIFTYSNPVKSNDVVAVLIGENDSALYAYKESNEGIILMPTNLAYPPRFFKSKNEMSRKGVRILGRVVQQFRKY